MTAALCATDVWIEFNHQWLLYSTPFERTRNARTMHVTTPAGTDVTFEIDPVHYVACDCGDATFPAAHMLTGQINVVPKFGIG